MRIRDASVLFALATAGACAEPTDEAGLGDPAATVIETDDPDPGASDPDSMLVRTSDGVERIHFRERDGRAVWDGDIVLGPIDLVRARARLYGGGVIEDFSLRWTNNVVRYRFDSEVTSTVRTSVETALAELAAITPLTFVNVGASPSGNYITYEQDVGDSWSWSDGVGMEGGEQTITLGGWFPSEATIQHETLHAIGLRHEQSRADAVFFLVKNPDCIDDWFQYETKTNIENLGLYDFDSLMHYPTGSSCVSPRPPACELQWNTDSDPELETLCNTMTRASTGAPIERNYALSREDVNMLWRMYNQTLGGDEANDRLGAAVAVGDFDGDKYDDVAIGAPGENGDAGAVFLYRGTSSRPVPWQLIRQSTAGLADEADDEFGAALFAIDVDADGKDDLVVGAPGEDVGTVVDSGAVSVLRGTTGGLVGWRNYTQSGAGLSSEEAGDRFGESVAAAAIAGSTDAWDRTIVIGAPSERNTMRTGSARSGAVFLIAHAADPADLYNLVHNKLYDAGGTASDRFGAAVAVGDLDVSGNADLAVGAPGKSGRGAVRVYVGRTPTPASEGMTSALVTYRTDLAAPEGSTAAFGAALDIGKLRSGSSREELAVGAPDTAAGAGAVYVYETQASTIGLVQIVRQNAAIEALDFFGAAVVIGNLDAATTQEDLAVGAPGENNGAGAVSIFPGATATLGAGTLVQNHHAVLNGVDEAGDRFGAALAAGKLDGIGDDGSSDDFTTSATLNIEDLVIGHPGEAPDNLGLPEGPATAGAFSVFVGRSGGVTGMLSMSQVTSIRD